MVHAKRGTHTRAGEALAEMEKNEGGRPSETPCIMQGVSPTYADLGIEKTQAHRWQLDARQEGHAHERAGVTAVAEIVEISTVSVHPTRAA